MSAPLAILRPAVPDPTQIAAIRALAERISREDGREPLSDQALTQVSSGSVQHALISSGGVIVGYGQLDGESLEVAAEPEAVRPVLHAFREGPLLVWSHGRHSRLVPVLEADAFERSRELHQLRRSLQAPIATPPPPDGVRLAAFVAGRDEDAWVRVNAAAFSGHPEQGRWTRADVEAREQEPWFDPAGLVMAWRGDDLLGFHWTKVHPDGTGEVYVIGVDPTAQGLGLGTVLLQHGLARLRERGCPAVLLYVDGDNIGAMRLYERHGFSPFDLDVQWRSTRGYSSVIR